MTCPECQIAYDPNHWDACPHCGCEHELAGGFEPSGVMRTSTILIAEGGGEPEFYGSLEEVPERLRRILASSTNGLNSGTIFIADRGGREQITRALRNLPAAQPSPAVTRFSGALTAQPAHRLKRRVSLATLWFALVMASFSGGIIWLLGSRSW